MISAQPVTLQGGLVLHKVLGPDAVGLQTILSGLTGGGTTFPGPQPVSIDRGHFGVLQGTYFLSEKTDGVRYAMLVCSYKDAIVTTVFDRTLTPYLFPLRETPRAMAQGTVLDGELVYDKHDKRWVYLVFDAIVVSGVPVSRLTFKKRLDAAAMALECYSPSDADPAAVLIKPFLLASPDVASTYADRVKEASTRYGIDGIIFMPADEPVCYGRHDRLFKLKQHHTIDFLARNGKLHIYDETARRNKPVGTPAGPNAGLAVDGAIVECELCRDKEWTVLSVRTDKKTANNKFTFEKTLLNLQEKLRLEDVLGAMFPQELTARGTARWAEDRSGFVL